MLEGGIGKGSGELYLSSNPAAAVVLGVYE